MTPSLNIPDTGKLNGDQIATYQEQELGSCHDFVFSPSSRITLYYEEGAESSWTGSLVKIGTSDHLSYFCQPANASWPVKMEDTLPMLGLECHTVKTGTIHFFRRHRTKTSISPYF